MRAVVQRVKEGSVEIKEKEIGKIEQGLVVLLGVGQNDTEKDAEYIAEKIINLRIFEDKEGKMKLSLKNINGQILVISQFTLYGDCKKGRPWAQVANATLNFGIIYQIPKERSCI